MKDKSKISFICPNVATIMSQMKDSTAIELLNENLWIVNNESYWACNASSPGSRLLMKCDSPFTLKYYPIVFQQYSGSLNSLEFNRGEEYFFIGKFKTSRFAISEIVFRLNILVTALKRQVDHLCRRTSEMSGISGKTALFSANYFPAFTAPIFPITFFTSFVLLSFIFLFVCNFFCFSVC